MRGRPGAGAGGGALLPAELFHQRGRPGHRPGAGAARHGGPRPAGPLQYDDLAGELLRDLRAFPAERLAASAAHGPGDGHGRRRAGGAGPAGPVRRRRGAAVLFPDDEPVGQRAGLPAPAEPTPDLVEPAAAGAGPGAAEPGGDPPAGGGAGRPVPAAPVGPGAGGQAAGRLHRERLGGDLLSAAGDTAEPGPAPSPSPTSRDVRRTRRRW